MARHAGFLLALALTACSASREGSDPTSVPRSSATTEATTTTITISTTTTTEMATTTTEMATTTTDVTTTTAAATTTTAVAGSAAPLRRDGFSSVPFGTDAETAVAAVTAELGAPTGDTGWVDPLSISTCAGTLVRRVTWGNLALLFGDASTFAQGAPHFLGWSYGSVEGVGGEPVGLVTPEDVGLGDTVADLRAAYPAVTVTPGESGLLDASFYVDEALGGLLTGDTDADTLIVISGGPYCG